jgi:hypothetical protein
VGKIISKENHNFSIYRENKENNSIERCYNLLLNKPLELKINGANKDINEVQILFENNIDKEFSHEDTFYIYGNLFLKTSAYHYSEVLISVNKIENRTKNLNRIYDWLVETHGNYRGQPIPNWFFILIAIILLRLRKPPPLAVVMC